jgi:hypothetical protein
MKIVIALGGSVVVPVDKVDEAEVLAEKFTSKK